MFPGQSLPLTSGLPQTESLPPQQFADRLNKLHPKPVRPLSDAEADELSQQSACMHCRGHHARACPKLKRISFHPNSTIAEVEFWPPDQIDWTGVVFLDQGGIEDDIDESSFHALRLLLSTLSRPAVAAQVNRRADREQVASAIQILSHLVDIREAEVVDSPA